MKTNNDFAELLGAFIGDGWIESRGSGFYILGNPIEDKEYHNLIIKPLFEKVFKVKAKIRHFKQWRAYGVYTYSKKIISLAIKNGFQKGKKAHCVVIPERLLTANTKFLISIVRGIFDTDGSFYCKRGYSKYDNYFRKRFHCYPKIEIVSISPTLLNQVNSILNGVKIESIVRLGNAGGLINNRLCKPSFRLTIYKQAAIIKFFDVIRPNNPRHITRYKIWRKFGFLPPKTNINDRKKMLKKEINPYNYYAGVPERSNGLESLTV